MYNPRYIPGTDEYRAYRRELVNRWNREHPERAREIWNASNRKKAAKRKAERLAQHDGGDSE